MYNDNYNMPYGRGGAGGPYDRKPMDDRGMGGERRPPMGDRAPPMLGDRRPLLDGQGGPPAPVPPPNMSGYDRRPQPDMYSRRDAPPKPM